MNELNPQQYAAVNQTEGPMLVLAGAGSGKTKVLTKRVAYLIKNGVHPLSILAITFTNKAANEMKERIAAEIGCDVSHMWISTFHSMCVRILRVSGKAIGYTSDFSIYDSEDTLKLIKNILSDLGLKEDKFYSPKLVRNAISRFKNSDSINTDPFTFCDEKFPLISYRFTEIFDRYQAELLKQNAMDFDDLLLKTYELFASHPEVLNIYQNRFKYVLVDEYQDTNMIQYNLIKMISEKYKNIFVVGDDDQSIYAFRGANIENILNFEKDFSGAKVIKLEQNYRSDESILDVANSIIRNNTGRKGKTLWSSIKSDNKPCFYCAKSEYDEAEFIAREIRSRVNGGMKYSDFAVLYRNHTLSRLIEEKLRIYSIPYNVYGGTSFYERREIKDILAYLTLLVNPDSDVSFLRIINVPKRGIGNVTISKIRQIADTEKLSCLEVCLNAGKYFSESIKNKLDSFVTTFENIQTNVLDMSVHEIIDYIIDQTDYKNMLYSEYASEAQMRFENLDEFVNSAYEFENSNDDVTLSDFIQSISLITDMDTTSDDNAVTLMTMHAAKGLEYAFVFVCGMEEKIFPSSKSVEENGIEEERRLCYVAVTRAKYFLYLLCSEKRTFFGNIEYNPRSRFIEEIESDLFSDISPEKDKYIRQVDSVNFKEKLFTGNVFKPEQKSDSEQLSLFVPGVKVRHKAFGEGVIISVAGTGKEKIAVVDFEKAGQKKMFLSFAPLEVV